MSNKLSPLEKAVIGSLASVIANTAVYPLDIAKTLIQSQQNLSHYSKQEIANSPNLYRNSLDCLQKLFKKHGLKGLYIGLLPSLSSTASMNFAYFFWYAVVRKIYDRQFPSNKSKSTAVELGLGAIAGALSQLIFMSISTISTKQQTQVAESHSAIEEEKKKSGQSVQPEDYQAAPEPSFWQTAEKIVKQDGLSGLWSGLKVSLVLTTNPSITYGAFERLRSLFFSHKTSLSALESFTLGVFSKLLATIFTQPLIVSKVMIQKKSTVVTEKVVDPVTKQEKYIKTRKNFKSFQECLVHLFKNDGILGLWKGVLPQISKAVIVQGFLFMFKEKFEELFVALIRLIKLRRKRALLK